MTKCKLLCFEGSRCLGAQKMYLGNGGPYVFELPKIEETIEKYLMQGYVVKNITAGDYDIIFVYLEKK